METGIDCDDDDIYLSTERLDLRWFRPTDLALLVDLDSDPDVMHFITGGRPSTVEELRDDVLPAFVGCRERGDGYGFWAAIERSSGEFVGWFHLRPAAAHPADEPELGYRLKRTAWGKGFATEGSRALIALAFERLGARRVVAETMAVHTASRRVMEKSGMHLVRMFHQPWPDPIPGDEQGDVEYAIERPGNERE